MKRILLASLALLLCAAMAAQRTGVREEVRSSWNKSSGLDCVYDLGPKAATPAPRGYEAVYISHYGRHGSRYAYTEKAYSVFLNLLSDIERISDICSNVGVFTIARVKPEMKHEIHDYVSVLHSGKDETFNREYQAAHDHYFELLNAEEQRT